jgi:hypothetical protein
MHFKSLLHVRDHAKVVGTARQLLQDIALHVNMHTGEAFELSVDRLAHRLDVTPQWVRRLKARLVEAGELIVQQSRGRRPNIYRIPTERCHACQATNPKQEFRVAQDPDEGNPKLPRPQPETVTPSTRNYGHLHTRQKVLRYQGVEPETGVLKESGKREKKEPPIFSLMLDKPERQSRWWCDAHGFCHSERLPDHRPGCVQEREVDDSP